MAVKDELVLLFGILMVTSSSFIVLGASDGGEPINRVALAFARVLITGIIAFFILGRLQFTERLGDPSFFSRHPKLSVVIAGFSLAIHFASFFISLDFLPVGVSLSLTNTAPIWMLVIAIFFFKERPRVIDWVSIIMAIMGIVILGTKDFSFSGDLTRYSIGVLMALLSGIVLAIYLMVAKWGVDKFGLWRYFGIVNLTASGTLLTYILIIGEFETISPAALFYGLLLAIFPGLMGHASFQYAMSRLPTPLVGAATIGEPLLGTLLAFFFLGQHLAFLDILGIALTLLALVIVVIAHNSSSP